MTIQINNETKESLLSRARREFRAQGFVGYYTTIALQDVGVNVAQLERNLANGEEA